MQVSDLVQMFDVTGSTIRNDLRDLEKDGLIIRTHGGAIKKEYSRNVETKPSLRKLTDEKYEISDKAIHLLNDNDIIAIDTGTTCVALAEKIVRSDITNLTILTYDLEIALILKDREDFEVQVLGGLLRNGYPYVWGSNVHQAIEDFSVDKVFIATTSLDIEYGFSTPNSKTAALKKSLMSIARKKIILCESIKINSRSFSKFASINDFDYFVTDSNISDAEYKNVNNTGIEILTP
ncbi:DeoR/GlpR family DNA-binding transcription regulator [Alkalibacterium sp. m-11]